MVEQETLARLESQDHQGKMANRVCQVCDTFLKTKKEKYINLLTGKSGPEGSPGMQGNTGYDNFMD